MNYNQLSTKEKIAFIEYREDQLRCALLSGAEALADINIAAVADHYLLNQLRSVLQNLYQQYGKEYYEMTKPSDAGGGE